MRRSFHDLPGVVFKQGPFVLRGGHLYDAPTRQEDVIIGADGRITAIGHAQSGAERFEVIDVAGCLITPAFADCHRPLPLSRVAGAEPPLRPLARAAEAAIAECLRQGTTALRVPVPVIAGPLVAGPATEALEAAASIRDRLAGRMTVQVTVCFAEGAALDPDWLGRHALAALRVGDLIGGAPARAAEPAVSLDCLFWLARDSGLPLALCLDGAGPGTARLLDIALDRVEEFGMQGRASFMTGQVPDAGMSAAWRRTVARLRGNDVAVVTPPPSATAGDAALLRDLIAAGVSVALDPAPLAGLPADMAGIAGEALFAAEAERILDMVSIGAGRIMGVEDFGRIEVGVFADLLISDAPSPEALLRGAATRRTVISRGHLVTFAG